MEQRPEPPPGDWHDIVVCVICAVIVIALHIAERWAEARVTEQERVERQQHQLQQSKLMEM